MKALRVCLYGTDGVGLGHLSRCVAIARALRRADATCRLHIVTAAAQTDLLERQEDISFTAVPKLLPVVAMPEEVCTRQADRVLADIEGWHPDILIVDSLPRGSFREFMRGNIISDCYSVFVARERRPDRMNRPDERSVLNRFAHVIVPHSSQSGAAVLLPSVTVPVDWTGEIVMCRRRDLLSVDVAAHTLGLDGPGPRNRYGLVAASSATEPRTKLLVDVVVALRDWLLELHVIPIICIPNLQGSLVAPGITHIQYYPIEACLRAFTFIIGPAGYNLMYSAAVAGIPGAFYALDRNVDDQYARLSRGWRNGLWRMIGDPGDAAEVRRIIEQLLACRSQDLSDYDDNGADRAADAILRRYHDSRIARAGS